MELTKTTSILWRNAKLTKPAHSGWVVAVIKSTCGANVSELHYSKIHDAFNAFDSCDNPENAIENVIYWCYTSDITIPILKEELNDE